MQKLLVILFCLGISLSKAQEIPHTWLLKHGVKKMFTYTIDSLNKQRLSRITMVDPATKTIIEKDPRISLFNTDTTVLVSRYNEWGAVMSMDYTSPEVHTLSTYVYPKNDSTEMILTHLSEIHRKDSLVYQNEWTSRIKTVYKNKKRVRYTYADDQLLYRTTFKTKGHTRTVKYKYRDKEPGLRPVKEVYITKGTNVFTTVWYRSHQRGNCTKMTVHRQKLYNKTDAVMEMTINTDYCGMKTRRYRFEYFY